MERGPSLGPRRTFIAHDAEWNRRSGITNAPAHIDDLQREKFRVMDYGPESQSECGFRQPAGAPDVRAGAVSGPSPVALKQCA